jgi:hypothetical protein
MNVTDKIRLTTTDLADLLRGLPVYKTTGTNIMSEPIYTKISPPKKRPT